MRQQDSMARVTLAGALLALTAPAGALGAPDLILSDVTGATHWTSAGGVGAVRAYSFGPQFCNAGDAQASWNGSSTAHPVFTSNVYRLADGRFEQVGQGFVFHEFFPLQQGSICGTCAPSGGLFLGPGCATPSTSSMAGNQGRLSGRSGINPATGQVPFPFDTSSGDPIYKRVQIAEADFTPGARYFAESIVVSPEDAPANNAGAANNASYRPLAFGGFTPVFLAPTKREAVGVEAWRDHGLGLNLPDASVQIAEAGVTAAGVAGRGGRFVAGARATNLGFGRWRYEYALENVSALRAAGSLSVAIPASIGAGVTNIDFHDIAYHSGEPFDGTDWPGAAGATSVSWATTETFQQNPNANALRWGTLYNFRFECDGPPVSGAPTIGLFMPSDIGDPNSVAVAGLPVPATVCAGDVNLDRRVNFGDLNETLGAFGATGAPGSVPGDVNGDGTVTFGDLNVILGNFGTEC